LRDQSVAELELRKRCGNIPRKSILEFLVGKIANVLTN